MACRLPSWDRSIEKYTPRGEREVTVKISDDKQSRDASVQLMSVVVCGCCSSQRVSAAAAAAAAQ